MSFVIEVTSQNIPFLPRYLYSAEQSKRIDAQVNNSFSPNTFELMYRAGSSVFELVLSRYKGVDRLIVFCGNGNNAGDGFVVAALAANKGIEVEVIQVDGVHGSRSGRSKEMQSAYKLLSDQNIPVTSLSKLKQTNLHDHSANTVVIDALIGSGLKGNVKPSYEQLISEINGLGFPIVSIDVPSGLCADTGNKLGCVVSSDYCVTFICLKKGMMTGNSFNYFKQLYFDDLGISQECYRDIESDIELIGLNRINTSIYSRLPTDHKGDSGRCLLIGGSNGMGGAAIIASEACLRAGAGLLKVLVGKHAIMPLLTRTPEVLVNELRSTESGDQVSELAQHVDAIAVGPGLGNAQFAVEALKAALTLKKATVLDADALNIIAADPKIWDSYGHNLCIMTPHPKEAARLLNCNLKDVTKDRYQAVKKLAAKFGCTFLLKGNGTLISNLSNNIFVCRYGNESMAVAGMGDALTGIILSLIAKYEDPLKAATYGAFLHGKAGERASKNGVVGVLPQDIIHEIKLIRNKTSR